MFLEEEFSEKYALWAYRDIHWLDNLGNLGAHGASPVKVGLDSAQIFSRGTAWRTAWSPQYK